MKTYKEYWAEIRAKNAAETNERKLRASAFFQSVMEIQIDPKCSKIRDNIITTIADGRAEFLNVACDNCGIELVNPSMGEILMSNPPKVEARCAGCGFCGYLPAKCG
jgi:ribosomal protein S27E